MSQLKLTADGGGGTVSLKGPSSTTGNAAIDITVPGTESATLDTLGRAGNILQVVSTTKKGATSFSVASGEIYQYTDSTLRATITPTSASNTLYIMGHVVVGRELLNWMHVGIGKDGSMFTQTIGDVSSNRGRYTVSATNPSTDMPVSLPFHATVTAENTSERYYNLNFRHGSSSSRTIYLNRGSTDTDSFHYPRCISTITVMEIQV